MNKTDLAAAVAKKTGMSKKDSEKAVNALTEAIAVALASGNKVCLLGFGTFEVKERAARTGRNPKTKEQISIPPYKAPVFKASKMLKETIS